MRHTPARGAVHDRSAMTTTIKNTPELNSPGKPGGPSQNSENKPGLSPRSNPVCLEVSVTIRSSANEAGGPAQPIREEAKSVIVFDNGAVLRSTLNLPVGLTVTLSSPSGREVISRVVGGRNLPNLKGYVEVEFLEPVNDFWGIHKDSTPAPVAAAAQPATSAAPREIPAPPTPAPSAPARVAVPAQAQAKPASVSLGVGPKFEDQGQPEHVTAPIATRESRTENVRPGPELVNKDKEASGYNLSAVADSTSLANWAAHSFEPPAEKPAISAKRETASIISPAPAHSRDFLSKGLMAYDQPSSSSGASDGRMPLIVGVAALVLAGVCGVVLFMRRGPAPVPAAKTAVASAPSRPEPPPANTPPEAVQAPQEDTAQAAGQTQTEAQPVSVEQPQPAAAPATVPAVVTGPANLNARPDSRADSRNVRRQEKSANAIKPPEPSTARQPVIASLKMSAPSAPAQTHADTGEGASPVTEIAAADASGVTPPAGLLTSAGRISKPPSPPPGSPAPDVPAVAPAPRTVHEPKLISSVRPEYPAAARQSNIQGTVTVSASIDVNGKVVSAKALNGSLLLRTAAENSVRQWKYSPGTVDGKPAPSQVTVGVEFRMN